MRLTHSLHRAVRSALIALYGLWTAQAAACTVTNPATDPHIGSYSPAAVKASAVPAGTLAGGINCSGTLISLLGGNVLTGTLGSSNGYQLTPINGGAPVTFKIYLDQAATKQMSTTAATNFLNPQVIDLLGLLGNSPSNIPLYVKVASTNLVSTGLYSGTFTVAWVWKICSGGTWVVGNCTLGTLKQGSATATIKFTLTIEPKPVTATITSASTWDPVSGATNPRVLPSAKVRTTIALSNPDIVAIDAASLVIDVPTANKTAIALDGDGTSGQVVQTTAGGSGLTLSYGGPSASNDNVEFSSDGGATFTYMPVAGSASSQAAVTTVRLKPQGSMAPGSTFTISLPYAIK